MCGINGIISLHRDAGGIVHAMNRHLHHRGPDGDGVYIADPLALGHVRLSILDLTNAGAQPMQFGCWVIVFNGEIYNFQALRDILVTHGYQFSSRSDTEVLLKAWDCWGEDCLAKLEGMFAFAIYDTQERRLHLCRDSYGVKPLFYSLTNNEFLFSSELSTLVHAQATLPEPDRDAISTYLALHYIPAPQTGLMNLFKLPSGHRMTVSFAESRIQALEPIQWDKPFEPYDNAIGITVDALDQALAHSVKQQMVSDVPLGAFLSGGVDSSLICHYASQVHKEPLHTFSIGFTDAGPEYDETAYAARAAKLLGSQHHAVCVELGSLSEHIDDILSRIGELNADSSVFLNHIVCAAAREHVTVCLSGAGGDELFGGYYRHQALLALEQLNYFPKSVVRLFIKMLSPFPQNRDNRLGNLVRRMIRFLEQREGDGGLIGMIRQDRVYPQQSLFLSKSPPRTLLKVLEYDFRHFLGDNILCFSDKMSMLHGLEVRVPFLDPGVVRLAEQMQNRQRVTLGEKKVLLKQLAARYFPHDLIYRKKQGFAAPVEVWLRKLRKAELKRRCMDGLVTQLLPEGVIDDLVENFVIRNRDLSLQLYSLIVMNQWFANL
ncbi:MAG: asparagine synthase (glutamine-hydrolyzing) [Desulfuromonadales bacterium]|nr:asparagine synthase (glutamine-hydrolyzing) [Desulfuromonadales bacterium]